MWKNDQFFNHILFTWKITERGITHDNAISKKEYDELGM